LLQETYFVCYGFDDASEEEKQDLESRKRYQDVQNDQYWMEDSIGR